jgi:hypothetical protein
MMSTYKLGQNVVYGCCSRKESIVNAIAKFDLNTHEGVEALRGALDASLEIIGAFFAIDGRVNGDYENLNHYRSRDLLMIAHRAHNQAKCSESIAKWNLGVILTAEAVRSQMVVSIDYPVAETEKQKVIPVEVVSMPTPEKVPVEVLSMPGRETETVIKRDGDGNIVSTSQIERDV